MDVKSLAQKDFRPQPLLAVPFAEAIIEKTTLPSSPLHPLKRISPRTPRPQFAQQPPAIFSKCP